MTNSQRGFSSVITLIIIVAIGAAGFWWINGGEKMLALSTSISENSEQMLDLVVAVDTNDSLTIIVTPLFTGIGRKSVDFGDGTKEAPNCSIKPDTDGCEGYYMDPMTHTYSKPGTYTITYTSAIAEPWETISTTTVSVGAQNAADHSDTYILTGHYESVEMKTEQKGDATCHTLAVSGGDESIINEFKDLITQGNTVQSLSVDGKVRVNLPWNTMSDAVKTKLQSGTSVTLRLIKEEQTRGDAINLCHSFFKSAELKS